MVLLLESLLGPALPTASPLLSSLHRVTEPEGPDPSDPIGVVPRNCGRVARGSAAHPSVCVCIADLCRAAGGGGGGTAALCWERSGGGGGGSPRVQALKRKGVPSSATQRGRERQ